MDTKYFVTNRNIRYYTFLIIKYKETFSNIKFLIKIRFQKVLVLQ